MSSSDFHVRPFFLVVPLPSTSGSDQRLTGGAKPHEPVTGQAWARHRRPSKLRESLARWKSMFYSRMSQHPIRRKMLMRNALCAASPEC
jgi:hypothetical protein